MRIHCFERDSIEGFPSNTYQSNDIDKIVLCIKELLLNEKSGISRILIENPKFGDSNCYREINCQSPMEL